MRNDKVLKARAKLYDDLLTCSTADCGNKFSDVRDLEKHIVERHHQKLTATTWWNQFKKALLANKDSAEVDNIKSGYNNFTWGELGIAAKQVIANNRGRHE